MVKQSFKVHNIPTSYLHIAEIDNKADLRAVIIMWRYQNTHSTESTETAFNQNCGDVPSIVPLNSYTGSPHENTGQSDHTGIFHGWGLKTKVPTQRR